MLSSTPERIHPILSRLYHILYKEKLSPKEIEIATKLISFMTIEKKEESEEALYQKLSEDIGETIEPSGILDINKAGHANGRTVLISAVYHGHFSFVQRLLDAKANPNQRNEVSGPFPLIFAAAIGAKANIHQTNKNYGAICLEKAAAFGHTAILRLLLEMEADPNQINEKDHSTPLYWACHNGHSENVRLLLDAKASLNNPTALMIASEKRFTKIVSILLNAKVNPNCAHTETGYTPLHWAIFKNHIAMTQLLVNFKANPNTFAKDRGASPLTESACKGQHEIVALLLDAKADPDQCNKITGFSALEHAAIPESIETCQLLLERKANPLQVNTKGSTALLQASMAGNVKVAALLLEAKSDIETKTFKNNTSLYLAISYKKLEMVVFLLMRGAKIHDFGALSRFLSEVDQLDENVLKCLKILHKPSKDKKISCIPVNEQKTAKLYMEKLEVLQTARQQGNLEMKKHFIDLTNEVLPKVLGEVVFSYDGRNFKPNSKVTFFQSRTIDPALQDLRNQMEAEGIKLKNM